MTMKYTMVIADDEPVVLKSTELFLKKEFPNIEIVGMAENGIKLKEMLEAYKPDMAIVDIRMPGLSGIEVIELLQHKKCSTHFIISTAYSDFGYIKKALDLKTDGYLVKPSKREEKLEVIGKLCRTVEEEKKINLRQDGIESALGVVNSVLAVRFLCRYFLITATIRNLMHTAISTISNFSAAVLLHFFPRPKQTSAKGN